MRYEVELYYESTGFVVVEADNPTIALAMARGSVDWDEVDGNLELVDSVVTEAPLSMVGEIDGQITFED